MVDKRKARTRLRKQKQRGALVLELACSVFFLSVFAVVAVHMGATLFGAFLNDRACRDAARAAAQGENATQATQLATAILQSHKTVAAYVQSPVLQTPIVYQDFGGSPPAQTSPFVTVTTSTHADLPFGPLMFFGSTLGDGTTTFTQTYTFPIVRVK